METMLDVVMGLMDIEVDKVANIMSSVEPHQKVLMNFLKHIELRENLR